MAKKKKPKSQYRPRVRDDLPTRQVAWSKKMVAEGRCCICGRRRNLYARYCDRHAAAHRLRNRAQSGSKPWRPGGDGRPPKSRKKGRAQS